jgi:hypothetical protein
MLAHAGEELLFVMLPVLVFLTIYLIRTRRETRQGPSPTGGPCLYCGTYVPGRLDRCPECGFRARRGRIGAEAEPRTEPAR